MPRSHVALRALLAAAAFVLGVRPAHADGWYFSEALGGTHVGGELGRAFDPATFHVRLSLGKRTDRWAVEGFFSGTPLSGRDGAFDGQLAFGATLGLEARYVLPLGEHLSAYARGGLEHVWLDAPPPMGGYDGRALHYGAGLALGGKVRALGFLFWPFFFTGLGPKIHASVWLESGQQVMRLQHPVRPTLDGVFTTWTLGLSFGQDF